MNNYVYITLLTNNVYIQGVILLNETLKKVKSKYPLIVLVTEEVAKPTLDILDYLQIKWKLIDIVKIPKHLQNLQQEQNKKFIPPYQVLTKLQIYQQYEYDKICYLDSDIMILKNIDFLFKEDNFVCTQCFQYQRDNANKIYIDSDNNKIILFNTKKQYFTNRINTGFLLFSPKKYKINLIEFLQTIHNNDFQKIEHRVECDETILQLYLLQNNIELKILNGYFNTAYLPSSNLIKYIENDLKENSYFIHFAGPFKPWNISNQLFKLKRLIINEKEIPIFEDNSLMNKAIEIISNKLFSLPLSLYLNFSNLYLQEISQ